MSFLSKIDGNKTYILVFVGGLFAVVHFLVIGDYSMASFIQLGQDQAFLGMVAALRHGVAKVGNQGKIA